MARGFKHMGDKSIEMGQFETIEDGTYTVNGVEEFVPAYLDDKGNPIFKEVLGQMKVICKLRTVDGSEGPAFSATAAEFYGMVRAFGAEPDATYANRMSPGALLRAKEAANKAARKVQVEVRNGYVRFLPQAATPPEGKYTVRFMDAHRRDHEQGNYDFDQMKGKNGSFESLIFDFEIVGDGQGKPCLWSGFKLSEFFNNPFVTEIEESDGTVIRAEDEGTPLFMRDERTGGEPMVVRQWEIFARYFAPAIEDHEWQVDPMDSNYGVSEVLKPQYVIINLAKVSGEKVKVFYTKRQRSDRLGISMRDVELLNDYVDTSPKEASNLRDLLDYLHVTWPDIQIFEDESDPATALVFTEEGKEWARKFMGGKSGPWARAGLDPNDRRGLNTLTDSQITRLLAEFKSQYG